MAEPVGTGRGRLSAEREQEVYTAVLDLLVDVGYESLRMDAVAQRASCSKATLYRQWGSKEDLVVDALRATHPLLPNDARDATVDTGSLAGDLHVWARLVTHDQSGDVELLQAVLHACKTNQALGDAVRTRMIDGLRADFEAAFSRAIERGEISADDPALRFVTVMFAGSFIVTELLEGKAPDEAYVVDFIDSVLLPALGVS